MDKLNISLIAAIGANNELGKDNGLIWYLPEDLKFFKNVTTGHHIVMGMNTLKSLPKKLPNRKHIVLTTRNIELDPDIVVVHSVDELMEYLKTVEDEIYVIGGASVYNQMIDYASSMYLTEIEAECKDADVYYPSFDKDDWEGVELSMHESPEGVKYKHMLYNKKKK